MMWGFTSKQSPPTPHWVLGASRWFPLIFSHSFQSTLNLWGMTQPKNPQIHNAQDQILGSLGSCSCFPACFSKSLRLQCPVLSSQMVPKWCFFDKDGKHESISFGWRCSKHVLYILWYKWICNWLHVYIPAPEIPAILNSFWQVGPLIESTNDNEHHEGSCAEYHLNIYHII